jgi:hypothetical protein
MINYARHRSCPIKDNIGTYCGEGLERCHGLLTRAKFLP